MTHLWTQDAFDCLCIRLSFSHWLSLLFPLVLTVPSILSSLTVREYCPHGFSFPVLSSHSVLSYCTTECLERAAQEAWAAVYRQPRGSSLLCATTHPSARREYAPEHPNSESAHHPAAAGCSSIPPFPER